MCSLLHKIKLTPQRLMIGGALGLSLLIIAITVYVVRVNRRITAEREREAAATRVEVEERSLAAPSNDGLTLYLCAGDVRAVASFNGARYLATSGGLIEVDESANVKRRYTTLDGLPDNDLTALAVFRERLFVGTASAG